MEGKELLTKGITNWKLRLILSALLCIMGLAALISMVLGLFVSLSVYDRSIVAIAIWMVGVPTYLMLSGLANITPELIAKFINENVEDVKLDVNLLLQDRDSLTESEQQRQKVLIQKFTATPLYRFLPDKPVKQAYILMVISMIGSFGIWFIGG